MTPDPRTERIRRYIDACNENHLAVQLAPADLAYLLGRIEALENVADKARAAVAFIGWESSSAGDLADNLRAALAALDGGEVE